MDVAVINKGQRACNMRTSDGVNKIIPNGVPGSEVSARTSDDMARLTRRVSSLALVSRCHHILGRLPNRNAAVS